MREKYIEEARSLSEFMVDIHQVEPLTSEQCKYLGEQLFDFSDDGYLRGAFKKLFHGPTQRQLNDQLNKVLKSTQVISKVVTSSQPGAPEAIRILAGERDHPLSNQSEEALLDWLEAAPKMFEAMQQNSYHLGGEAKGIHVPPLRTGLAYKTLLVGWLLPNIFAKIFPDFEFGKQDIVEEYQGPGVTFVLECADILNLEGITPEGIRKAPERVKKAGLHVYLPAP